LAAIFVVTAWLVLLFGKLVLWPFPNAWRGWRNRVFRRWARSMAWALGMRIEIKGQPPAPPFFLVANHLSYLDIILLGSAVDAVFVSKAEVRGWPVMGSACAAADTIFINRSDRRDVIRVHAEMLSYRQRGHGLVMFPEGTSTAGADVAKFRSPLLEFPVRESMPVHAAALSYRTPFDQPPAHLAVCWWGDTPFFEHLVGLLRIRTFDATITFSPTPIHDEDRKSLATRLHATVSEHFTPVAPGRSHAA
jgi:1-acyl-sn-glycerol-3-phosphate acyltransferase